jgi:hypothetical protein
MANGTVVAICISSLAGADMQSIQEVEAIAGQGLRGDRYSIGEGSFNKGAQGRRQVTIINWIFFEGSGFDYIDSRRNIVTVGVELMWLIGREFQVGGAKLRGVKYCDPCTRPNKLGKEKLKDAMPFKDVFHDRGGLIAEVLEGGIIKVGDSVVPPPKGY